VWVLLAVVAVGVVVYLKKKSSTTTATTTKKATGTAAGYGEAGQGAPGGQGGGISGPTNYLEQALNANAASATTNPQWEANAEAVLQGYGYPFVQVQAALNQYLAGGVLSSVQQEIVNAAIEAVGAPPSAPTTPPAGTATPVTTSTGWSPPTGETQSGSGFSLPGETLAGGYEAPGQSAYYTEDGVTYVPFASPAAQWAAATAGTPIYQQTSPGVFTLTTPSTGVVYGTPVFEAVPGQ
jgi:hypothetical protein